MLKPYSKIFSIPAAIILAISALFVIALTATQTPTTDSAAAPVTRAADGFSAAQAYALRQGYDTRKTAAAGDQTLYMYLNMPQFFPHHVISRSGPIREAPVKLNPEIGRLVVKTTLGDLSLDDMLKDPRSRVQGYIVIHQGRIVYERYPGMRPTDNHLWWSSGKTLPGLLTAQLAAEGKLDAGKPVEFYLPEFSASGWNGEIMKQTARQTAQWIFAFATALIFCSPFFLRGGPKAASGAVLQTTAPVAAPDVAWRPNDDKAGGVSTPRYGSVERASRYITLKDGVRLALDVYLPKGLEAGARLPTMLEQTRYNRSYEFQPEIRDEADRPSQKITEFVTRGYAYVVVDVRGSGASFGKTQVRTWFFASGNMLGKTSPKDRKDHDAYKVDYSAGTGNQSRWNTLVGGGPVDYPDRAAEDGKLLTYTSAPLEQDLEVTGHPVVRLFVSSTATDGQFFVYLAPDSRRHRRGGQGSLRTAARRSADDSGLSWGRTCLARRFASHSAKVVEPIGGQQITNREGRAFSICHLIFVSCHCRGQSNQYPINIG